MELPSFCMKWRGATWHQNLRVFCPVFQDGPCMKWCWFFHFIRGVGSSIPYRYSQGGWLLYVHLWSFMYIDSTVIIVWAVGREKEKSRRFFVKRALKRTSWPRRTTGRPPSTGGLALGLMAGKSLYRSQSRCFRWNSAFLGEKHGHAICPAH